MSCKSCKKKIVSNLSNPIDETIVINENKIEDIKRLNYIFSARNPKAYQTEIKELWLNVFETELKFDVIVAKRVFLNYIEVNKIVL